MYVTFFVCYLLIVSAVGVWLADWLVAACRLLYYNCKLEPLLLRFVVWHRSCVVVYDDETTNKCLSFFYYDDFYFQMCTTWCATLEQCVQLSILGLFAYPFACSLATTSSCLVSLSLQQCNFLYSSCCLLCYSYSKLLQLLFCLIFGTCWCCCSMSQNVCGNSVYGSVLRVYGN